MVFHFWQERGWLHREVDEEDYWKSYLGNHMSLMEKKGHVKTPMLIFPSIPV